jgi:hypothetical protein
MEIGLVTGPGRPDLPGEASERLKDRGIARGSAGVTGIQHQFGGYAGSWMKERRESLPRVFEQSGLLVQSKDRMLHHKRRLQ